MAASHPNSAMLQQFQGLLGSGKGSDLTITCRGTEFEVHKVVLFTQSGHFDKLLCGPFKEANQRTIDLSEDHAPVIQVLVRYLYKHILDLSSRPDTIDASAFVVQIYKAADYYDVPQLRTPALQHLRKECDPAKDEEDFIEALRVVGVLDSEKPIWSLLLTKLVANKTKLLKNELFNELITKERPEINHNLVLLGTAALPFDMVEDDDAEEEVVAPKDPTPDPAPARQHLTGVGDEFYPERRYRRYRYYDRGYKDRKYRERRWQRRWYY